MLVSDALTELRGSLLRDVKRTKSGPAGQFWTDTALLLYLNDAQRRFCRRSFCLRDAQSPLTQVTIAQGVDTYSLDPSIIFVIGVRYPGDIADVPRTKHANRVNVDVNWDIEPWSVNQLVDRPFAWSSDEGFDFNNSQSIQLRLYPVPDITADTKILQLRVIRGPIQTINADSLNDDLETIDDYALDMIEWAAWRALRNWDVDAEDRKKAEDHRKRFEDAVLEVRTEIMRKVFQPLGWVFGLNGFTYQGRV